MFGGEFRILLQLQLQLHFPGMVIRIMYAPEPFPLLNPTRNLFPRHTTDETLKNTEIPQHQGGNITYIITVTVTGLFSKQGI